MQYIFLSNRIKAMKEWVTKLLVTYYFGEKFYVGAF